MPVGSVGTYYLHHDVHTVCHTVSVSLHHDDGASASAQHGDDKQSTSVRPTPPRPTHNSLLVAHQRAGDPNTSKLLIVVALVVVGRRRRRRRRPPPHHRTPTYPTFLPGSPLSGVPNS